MGLGVCLVGLDAFLTPAAVSSCRLTCIAAGRAPPCFGSAPSGGTLRHLELSLLLGGLGTWAAGLLHPASGPEVRCVLARSAWAAPSESVLTGSLTLSDPGAGFHSAIPSKTFPLQQLPMRHRTRSALLPFSPTPHIAAWSDLSRCPEGLRS